MEISPSKSAAFGFFFLSLQLLTLSVGFPQARSGRVSCGSSCLQQRVWISRLPCEGNASVFRASLIYTSCSQETFFCL